MSQDGPGNGGEWAPVPSAPTEGLPEGFLAPGQVLGDRYQIRSQLGRGGMGEVWRAFDLKLRVEVALKAMLPDLFKDERRRDLLRREVRAAREVVSPNVCRIFDLIEVDGRELVSMEYVDGGTLLGVLHERGPLDLKEAQDIASQFLAGLEAIHQAGLVHRDVKPENIMITRAGRVVLMDFGLARQEDSGAGTMSGTPAYMAPEQAMGGKVDARADVYSAGVVLAEMVSPDGIKDLQSRQSVWEGIRHEPARVPDTPWAPVLKKAVAKEPDSRYNSAHTLTRALEDVTLRVEGAEDLTPYPGLASFTKEDAEYFFGREAEAEQMWRRLEGAPRMLALIGPSGAGKTSFIRAGVIPNAGGGWAIATCNPGNAAFRSLRQELASELAGDAEALRELVDVEDLDATVSAVARWRRQNEQALLIVDQFEELFTHSPPEVQARFTELLGRLVLEADVFVLLSMRDDFFFRCHEYEALNPVATDLTLLGPPTGAALRRALVQPAMKCGYRFEDDDLVDEMLAEVEGERGALPLLAFAAARLWDKRDRENGLLTRQAYGDIGGVGGALARHAETTLDSIGAERQFIVRELFRNLITAEGTRAVREWDELLSVFGSESTPLSSRATRLRAAESRDPPKHGASLTEGTLIKPGGDPSTRASDALAQDDRSRAASEVLRELIDARLLTSYEIREDDVAPTRRVEIIHESLLANWPRLVRWQTQDVDSAQLRDQLRQAARTWDEHDRSDDMLWTGSAYREFALWRERYPGGLTEVEEAFAAAMTRHARRRKRRQRIVAASALALAVALAAIFATLWRHSVQETRRAEAAKLLALAEVQFDDGPTEALAFATSSLELADTEEARVFAMRALWAGPPLRALNLRQASDAEFMAVAFSPDGRWLAVAPVVSEEVLVWNERGGTPTILGGHKVTAAWPIRCRWTRDGFLVTGHPTEERVRVWSMPAGRLIRTIDFGHPSRWQVGGADLLVEVTPAVHEGEPTVFHLKRWSLPNGEAEDLGLVDWDALEATSSCFDPGGREWIYAKGNSVYSRALPVTAGVPDRVISRHSSDEVRLAAWRRPDGFYSSDSDGEIILWATADGTLAPGRRLRKPGTATMPLFPAPSGRWAVDLSDAPRVHLWDLAGLAGASPWALRRSNSWIGSQTDFHPREDWVISITDDRREVSFWPLSAPLPFVVNAAGRWGVFEFTPDGRHLLTSDRSSGQRYWAQRVRLWPVPGAERPDVVDLEFPPSARSGFRTVTIDPEGERVLSTGFGHNIFLLSVSGGEPRQLEGFPANDLVHAGAFSPSGRLVAAASMISDDQATLRVWDLETGAVQVFDQPKDPEAYEGYYAGYVSFVDEATLYTSGANGLLRWDLETGTYEQVLRAPAGGGVLMQMTADRQKMLVSEVGGPQPRRMETDLFDLRSGEVRSLNLPRGNTAAALSREGTIWVSGTEDGLIRVRRTVGGEQHLLFGHVGTVDGLAISPDLRWIASSGQDKTLRLWPMPDLSKPPLHTLPREELIAKLKTLTNLRVVRDEKSSTGWKLEVGRFPGWETVPEW